MSFTTRGEHSSLRNSSSILGTVALFLMSLVFVTASGPSPGGRITVEKNGDLTLLLGNCMRLSI